jgi:hypothetical protein
MQRVPIEKFTVVLYIKENLINGDKQKCKKMLIAFYIFSVRGIEQCRKLFARSTPVISANDSEAFGSVVERLARTSRITRRSSVRS